ncbi:hypothetical protein [Bordetella bronchialis]|uniref:Uncharacterized protein n=1 Tax=Bordetella bronchialis TaxID=463025 RepID=A0A193FTD0_9BORD|nr:hypothetical protein [Bordetella bronchialis]ANN70895.1 hypothetical protein BAU08_05715 [Bordetella bronchialis]
MNEIEFASGQTHKIKGGRGKQPVEAVIINVLKRGRGHTVAYRVGNKERQASAGSFRSKLVS